MTMTAKAMAVFSLACLLGGAGCKDRRIDSAPAPARQVHVDTPAGEVSVETNPPAAPGGAKDVKVDVGPGGVKVNVDGESVRERIQERREERLKDTP